MELIVIFYVHSKGALVEEGEEGTPHIVPWGTEGTSVQGGGRNLSARGRKGPLVPGERRDNWCQEEKGATKCQWQEGDFSVSWNIGDSKIVKGGLRGL